MKIILPMINGAAVVLFILICLAFTTQQGRSIVLNEPVVPKSVIILTESGKNGTPTLQDQASPFINRGYIIKDVSISLSNGGCSNCNNKLGYMILEKY